MESRRQTERRTDRRKDEHARVCFVTLFCQIRIEVLRKERETESVFFWANFLLFFTQFFLFFAHTNALTLSHASELFFVNKNVIQTFIFSPVKKQKNFAR